MEEQEKKGSLIKTGIATMVVVFVLMGAYGSLRHFVNSTQLHAVDQQHTKTQERFEDENFGYAPLPENSVMTVVQSSYGVSGYSSIEPIIGEIDVSTRDIASTAVNPIPVTVDSLEKGKQLFFNLCSKCHGENGDGRGLMGSVPSLRKESQQVSDDLAVYLSGYLGYIPNVNANFVQEESVGEIYYTITNGGEAIMPPYKDALNPEERWHVINYIKHGLGEPDPIETLENLTHEEKVKMELEK